MTRIGTAKAKTASCRRAHQALTRHDSHGSGERHPSPEVSVGVVERQKTEELLGKSLTKREMIILRELAKNLTLETIARRQFVTRNTVKSQVRSIYRKFGVRTRADALAWARQHRILS